jgi:hypothetical protein
MAGRFAQSLSPGNGKMLVSHGYRFIYTKTRKTAGTSVESYFEPFCMRDGECSQRHFREEYVSPAGIIGYRSTWSERRTRARHRGLVDPRDRTGLSRIQTVEAGAACWWNHMPAWLIREQLGDETWKGYFKFCVIRHPFEKAISAYYHSKRLTTARRGGRLELWNEDDPQRFEAWLERSPPPADRDVFCIDDRFALDDVIRYENLLPDIERVCDKLGVPWEPVRFPALKAGVRPPEAAAERMYTPRSRELVAKAYRFELRYFGYEFPAPAVAAGDV